MRCSPADLRLAAHRIADAIYEKLTGDKGVFSTRIAYVTRAANRYTLRVTDADGEGGQVALNSREPIISPAWSPDGKRWPTCRSKAARRWCGCRTWPPASAARSPTSAAATARRRGRPTASTLAVTLSRDGGSQLYLMDRERRQPAPHHAKQRHRHRAGVRARRQQIYFVSDRGGSPQIYRMAAGGGNAERVTFSGSYNISPALSPDGRTLAYITRNGSRSSVHDAGPRAAARCARSPTPATTKARASRPTAG